MALEIEKLVSGGRGLAHINGKSVFVQNALPGEVVEVDIISEKRGFIEAETSRFITVSPDRITPPCPYYGICGGCDFQYVSPAVSARLKEDIVKDNLKRIGAVDDDVEFLTPSYGAFEGFRSRVRLHVDLKTKKQGFLMKKSNKLVEVTHCPALDNKLNALLATSGGEVFKKARSLMFENKINKTTGFVEVPLFAGDESVSMGSDNVRVTVSGIPYSVNANVFFQSNLKVLPDLFSFVKEHAIGENIMDLYSGVGTFSALFEGSGKNLFAVERQKECLALSRKNAPSAISYTSDVASWARKTKTQVDCVIVDPPRVGLEDGVPEMISSWNAERIIYISCNSVTASRDIPLFKGYKLTLAKVFDFYPGSGHEESGFILDRIH